MINTLTVMNALQNVLISDVNSYLTTGMTTLSSTNVLRDIPSVDNMPSDAAVFIVLMEGDNDMRTTGNDVCVLDVTLTILCKRDTQENLDQKALTYEWAIYQALRNNQSLGGIVDFTLPYHDTFWPEVEMNRNVQGLDISVSIQFEKDF